MTYVKELLDDFAVNRVLVIAPKRVAEDTWTREANKWDHLKDLRVSKVLGSEKERLKALETPADIYVINRENTQWLVEHYAGGWPFDMVVIDELSSFKNPQAKRFRMLRRVIRISNRVIGLTGTPAANGYMDLFAEMYLIDGGKTLGKTLSEYRSRYFRPGAHNGYVVYEWLLRPGAKAQIDKGLSDCCLSMSKKDWLELPPIMFNEVYVCMNKKERDIYERFKAEKILPLLQGELSSEDFDSAIVGDTAAVLSNKLLQMANGSVYDNDGQVFSIHEHKLEALEEIAESSNGQPLLVFYSYRHDLERIKKRFPDAVELKSAEDISAWNAGEIPMLLAHPASAAYGINLQDGGSIIVWFGLPWSLEQYTQANARLYRQGQKRPVIAHHIICEDTLDARVLSVLTRKDATQKSLLDALKSYVKESIDD